MSKNIEIIKELELEIGFKLREYDPAQEYVKQGYILDLDNKVRLLQLNDCGLETLPVSFMKILIIFFILFFICIMSSNLKAQIYSWTDENGKKHYSNVAPPDNLKNVKNLEEISNDDVNPENQNAEIKPKKKTKIKRSTKKNKVNTKVVQQVPAIRETGLKIVDDPATADAINAFNKKKQEIGLKCKKEMAMKNISDELNCMCKHMAEIIKANQAKIDAFLGLMNRRPELVNQMVKIEGVFGNWFLDPSALEMENRNNVQFFKRRYNCR